MFQTNKFYERTGFASLDDLSTDEWKEAYKNLDLMQENLFNQKIHTDDYIWPINPLQNQTRPWEYPYVYCNINKILNEFFTKQPLIVDLGSGFTFFPFAIAKLGADVNCVDIDLVPKKLYEKAEGAININSGTVKFVEGSLTKIPFESNSLDIIYSISVLEHLPEIGESINEIHRVLKNNGYLILTFDIDLQGNFDISPEKWMLLRHMLGEKFNQLYSEYSIHPQRLLTNQNHPFITKVKRNRINTLLREIYSMNKKFIKREINGPTGYFVSSFGACFVKKQL